MNRLFKAIIYGTLMFGATPAIPKEYAQYGDGGTTIFIRKAEHCVAQIIIPNRRMDTPGNYHMLLDLGELLVEVQVHVPFAPGADLDDTFKITVPDGYWADPVNLSVAENATGYVTICADVGV